jgi:hypothetical protein
VNGLWEIQYVDNSGDKPIEVTAICHSIVVACGKAQVPVTDHQLLQTLEGYTGQVKDARDVKNVEGT